MGDHGASEFGKEHGIVHEAIVTGRKVGADRDFWSRLAHDKEFFRQVVSLHRGSALSSVQTIISPAITAPYATAKKIFGKDFLGPEAIEKVYGIKLEEGDLPPIKMSTRNLKKFKRAGFQLILQIDKMDNGNPVTIRSINELAEGKASDGGKLLFSSDGKQFKSGAWYKSEKFLDEHLELCWRLSSKRIIDGTTSKNYHNQTEVLTNYLKTFRVKYEGSIRESTTELIYRLHLTERVTGEKLFSDIYVWTSTCLSRGRFVRGGDFGSGGARVGSDGPDYDWGCVGASLSLKI